MDYCKLVILVFCFHKSTKVYGLCNTQVVKKTLVFLSQRLLTRIKTHILLPALSAKEMSINLHESKTKLKHHPKLR